MLDRRRRRSTSFDDHFTQAALFFHSLTPTEQEHLIAAISFELAKCHDETIGARMVEVLASVDATLADRVAAELGLEVTCGEQVRMGDPSPALAQINDEASPIEGRVVGVVLPAGETGQVSGLVESLRPLGVTVRLIAPRTGTVTWGGDPVDAERTYATVRSIELDAAVIVERAVALLDSRTRILVDEVIRHVKPLLVDDVHRRCHHHPGQLVG